LAHESAALVNACAALTAARRFAPLAAGGEAAGCQRDLRSLAARGPLGRSPGRADRIVLYKRSSPSLTPF